ncbi:glycoside hydrolase [Byssothecium circinans]|uniref:beta-glucosidase n=1 Tax=Byssothecium circinans TaxID=147558 RepID=A0A6A5TA28_9PLEO|nr:glycoside hydrolase [Byssothecium circinans]
MMHSPWSALFITLVYFTTLSTATPQNGISSQNTTRYLDASLSPAVRAQNLLDQMTWEPKVGQMGGVRRVVNPTKTFNRTLYESVRATQNGNIAPAANYGTALQAVEVFNPLKEEQINSSRLHIPYIQMTDSMNTFAGGSGTLFPGAITMGAAWNIPLYEKVVTALRDENRVFGTYWMMSPEIDLARELRGGRVGEMFGEGAYHAGSFGAQYVKTMQEKDERGYVRVATTIKHFVYGSNNGGVNMGSIDSGLNHIMNDLAAPFHKVIKEAKPLAIMASYSSVDRVPVHANECLLQDILRGTLGFDGLIMSDAMVESIQDAAVMALTAGIGLELSPTQPATFPTLLTLTNDPRIVKHVDAAVKKILEIKFATGLFEEPVPSIENLGKVLRKPAHLEANRNISRESIVLLQNDGLLPLRKTNTTKVAVLGPFAALINAGNYANVNSTDHTFGNRLTTSLKNYFGSPSVQFVRGCAINNTDDASEIPVAVQAAKDAGLAILMLGSLSTGNEDPLSLERTDGEFIAHADLGFPGLQQQLLDAVLDSGVPTILVLSGGQSFVLNNSTLRANAILHSWFAGEYTSDAIVEIVTGIVNPSGKLPISIPQHSGALPVYYDFLPSDNAGGFPGQSGFPASAWQFPILQREVPMPFGFGLSYTTFDISEPDVSSTNGSTTISTVVRNTGNVAGQEVVQVYYRKAITRIETPNKQLVGFEKIHLAPGESREVKFSIPKDELGYWVNTKWYAEGGNYTFWVGTSSRSQDLKNVTTIL